MRTEQRKRPGPKPQVWDAYALRLPQGLKPQLEELATQNGRSLNAEIVQRLRASLQGYRR